MQQRGQRRGLLHVSVAHALRALEMEGIGMNGITAVYNVLVEILKELKIIRKHLETITNEKYKAGRRFDF